VEDVDKDPRLSQLSTQWTVLFEAHHGTPEEADTAIRHMMLRYSGAVHRYLLKTVADPDVVSDLDQEFAHRFLKGSFLHYDPKLGRFRDYVKKAVRNLMLDYYRRKGKTRHLDTDLEIQIAGKSSLETLEDQFNEAWRGELLDRAWNSLEDFEKRTGQQYHKVLRHRVTHPKQDSATMARDLAPALGRSVTAGAFRQLLQRAREKWAGFLIDEVKVSLKSQCREDVEEELADLKLLHLCKPYLERMGFAN
jgi:RNA polymerase sigma factor (sigma-70 family)